MPQAIGLDNPVFAGRLRDYSKTVGYHRRSIALVKPRSISDIQPYKPASPKPTILQKQPEHLPVMRLQSPPRAKNHRKPKGYIALTGLAVALFSIGIAISVWGLKTNRQVRAQVQSITKASERDAVVETPPDPSAFGGYSVAPTQPRFIRIPKLSVKARVQRVGVDAKNKVRAPSNIYDTGWYENSAKPGDAGGATLIDGHVHGPTKPGVFYNLKELTKGDRIQMERGDGKLFSYTVVRTQTYAADKVDMAAALVPVIAGKVGLNLITCSGDLDTRTNYYEDRLIVFAVAD